MKINISNDKYKQLARNLELGCGFTIFPRQLGKKSAEFEIIGDNETQVVFPVEAGTDIYIESVEKLPLGVVAKVDGFEEPMDYHCCTEVGVWFESSSLLVVPSELRDGTGECQPLGDVKLASVTLEESTPAWERWLKDVEKNKETYIYPC